MQETRFRAQQGSELLSLFVTVLVLMLPCMVYAVTLDIATYLDTKSSSLVTRDAVFDATC